MVSSGSNHLRVLVVHAGGTLGMVMKNGCYEVMLGYLESSLRGHPRLNYGGHGDVLRHDTADGSAVVYDILEEAIKDSSDANVGDFVEIMRMIEAHYDMYDGFVVVHGTDTMCYAGAAVSFMIDNISKPVVFTGAMVPLSVPGSDAEANLRGSFGVLAGGLGPGVYLHFNGATSHALRSFKIHATSPDAFRSEAGVVPAAMGAVAFRTDMCPHVSLVKVTPYVDLRILREVFARSSGVVLESLGSGNVSERILGLIREFGDKLVVNVTQCPWGRVEDMYVAGHELSMCANVISGEDMTTEAALAKLSFLIGQLGDDTQGIKAMFSRNLRGEVTFQE